MASITYSPVLPLPRPEEIAGLARLEQVSIEEAAARLLEERERSIARMMQDPAIYGYVPPIWKVCGSLLGASWVNPDLAEQMRRYLQFEKRVKSLLILGGNRSGKTQFECYFGTRTLIEIPDARLWMFHMTHTESVEYHQSLMWQMIPKGWRRKIKTLKEYISYSEQRGFTDNHFILANGSRAGFRNYSQDMRNAVEGGETDCVCADELIPAEWVETLEFRLATRNGVMLIGFTPVDGYSNTVQMFCDGATVVKESPAFLLPQDGGPPDAARALGLTDEEFAEVSLALDENRKPECVPCRPEDCLAWLDGGLGHPEVPEGRKFETMPRVLKCAGGERAVVYFRSNDNPFGGAANVIRKTEQLRMEDKRIRFYGFAEKLVGARFHTFDERVHVLKAKDIPGHGTNYMIVDPCSGRAFFMLWIRVTPDGKYFVYREWPGNYDIPGVGVPEPWAEPSTGKERDGKMGKGQKSPGWGLCGYKREIARLEQWRMPAAGEAIGREKAQDGMVFGKEHRPSIHVTGARELPMGNRDGSVGTRRPTDSQGRATNPLGAARMPLCVEVPRPEQMGDSEWVASWNERGQADEKIFERFMDARFANTKSFEEGGMVTLIEKFEEIGLTFYDSSTGGGKWSVSDGCEMIEDALAYDKNEEISFFNEPKLYISEECVNLIFAMKVWTGLDGQKGATKDPVDCLRMGLLKGMRYVDVKMGGTVAGAGCY